MRDTFGGDFNLVGFGGFNSGHQTKITANTVVLSQVMMNELIHQTKIMSTNLFSFLNCQT